MEWALRDLFVAYVDRMQTRARRAYEVDLTIWAVLAAGGAKVKKPDPPAVLKAPKIVIGG
jgi:hypothetical protein